MGDQALPTAHVDKTGEGRAPGLAFEHQVRRRLTVADPEGIVCDAWAVGGDGRADFEHMRAS